MNSDVSLPEVSVVVPVYNGEMDLPELIECLRSQTYPIDSVEYLLVDNNSRDRTSTIIQAAASNTPSVPPLVSGGSNFNRITIRPLAENQIQSSYAARNLGIRASTGEIIAFTDADCRPESDWLENLVKPFVDKEVGISAGEILALPGKTILEQHSRALQYFISKTYSRSSFLSLRSNSKLSCTQTSFRNSRFVSPLPHQRRRC
jgi:glycosyltransferase involved in cell wall biosynthesis